MAVRNTMLSVLAMLFGAGLIIRPVSAAAVPGTVAAATAVPSGVVALATFDGAPGSTQDWFVTNDPVMGGVSRSTFAIDHAAATMNWTGEVRIVPSLKAPGFCNLETTKELTSKFADAKGTEGLLLRLHTTTPGYVGFKVSFAARTLLPQFKSFKSNFNFSSSGPGWVTIAVPWNQFSNDWSPFTGDCDTKDPTGTQHHCCSSEHPEVCPKANDLSGIQALGLWTEGASGNFTLDVLWIGAGASTDADLVVKPAAPPAYNYTCSAPVQHQLRYNVSNRLASEYLPFPTKLGESLVVAICCDAQLESFAEPPNFFARPDIFLFSHMASDTPTTFYDPVCGIPLFRAPINRTLADFQADTTENNWPSFRAEEAITANLVVQPGGRTFSKCGTHLGDYMPDQKGARYCIDLSCISGNPTV